MKRILFTTLALLAFYVLGAQESRKLRSPRSDSPRSENFQLPDSLRADWALLFDSISRVLPLKTDFRVAVPMKVNPSVTMSSVVVIQKENLPARVTVMNNNTLRLGRHFTLSNGQVWNNGSLPGAFLDARTLSFPMPR